MDIAVSFEESDLVFVSGDESVHFIADDGWDPARLTRRDRAVLHALVTLAVEKLGSAD